MSRLTVLLASIFSAATVATAAAAQAPDGAIFLGGAARGGVVESRGVERPGWERWAVSTDGPVRSSPLIVDDVVYVGSFDGALYAIDLASGVELWRAAIGGPVIAAPAVDGEQVFVADREGTLVAVERATGTILWRSESGTPLPWAWGLEGWDYVGAVPSVADGLIVVGSGDGRVRALDASSGQERWVVQTGGRVRSSPAVADGHVYVGSADGVVRSIDLHTGVVLWRFETEGVRLESAEFGFDRRTISGGVTVAEGRVFVGSRDARMYALDAVTGEQVWSNDDNGASAWIISTPAIWNSLVLFGRSSSGKVQALDAATGALRWETTLGALTFSSPVIAEDLVYVTTGGEGRLVALDAATGDVRWDRALYAESWATPAIQDGVVVTAADDGVVRAIEAAERGSPILAVFYDSVPARPSLLQLQGGRDRTVATELVRAGYLELGSGALLAFLEDRVRDRVPSVVVMATDALPTRVAPAAMPGDPLHSYLESGGKVVWLGDPPFWLSQDSTTGAFDTDVDRARAYHGVDYGEWVRDSRVHRPTATGSDWGLDGWWVGPGGVAPSEVTTVLASDDEGRASVWVKSYGGPVGTGWVNLPWRPAVGWSSTLRAVAEVGVIRRFPTPHR